MLAKAYLELRKSQEKEMSEFPVAYAFNDKQLEEALIELGAKSSKECVTIFGHGDIVKKENKKAFIDMLVKHSDDIRALIVSDKDAAYEAFLYEMNNHEYAINYDGDGDVLNCFGLDFEQLEELGLRDIYISAAREHRRLAREWF